MTDADITTPATATQTPPPTPPVPPVEAPPAGAERDPDDIRKDFLFELSVSSDVAAAAKKPEYMQKLLDEGLVPAEIPALASRVESARGLITSATSKKTDTRQTIKSEAAARRTLLVLLGQVRSLAKAAYRRGSPRRVDYRIGKPIDKSRAQLIQSAHAILSNAKSDPSLKASAALLAKLEQAQAVYLALQSEQSDKRSEASGERQRLEREMKALAEARRGIQYFADAAWPAREKEHGPIRREFRLHPNRGLV